MNLDNDVGRRTSRHARTPVVTLQHVLTADRQSRLHPAASASSRFGTILPREPRSRPCFGEPLKATCSKQSSMPTIPLQG